MSEIKEKKTNPEEIQIEGIRTNVFNKFCNKCQFTDVGNKFSFCPHDGNKLQEPESLNTILDTTIESSPIIFQRQSKDHIIEMEIGKFKQLPWIKAVSAYSDGTFDVCIKSRGPVHTGEWGNVHPFDIINDIPQIYNRDGLMNDTDKFQINGLGTFKIPYILCEAKGEKLSNILIGLIHYRITDPVCRKYMFFNVNKDCWNDDNYDDEDIADFKLVYNQIEEFPRYSFSDQSSPKYDGNYKSYMPHYELYKITYGGNKTPPEDMMRKFIETGMDDGVDVRSWLTSLGINCRYRKDIIYPAKWLPKRTSESSKEDIELRNLLGKIRENVYYSRKNRKLYSNNQLIETFKLEGKIIKNLNFESGSEHVKILNVDIYILNDEIDGLFFFVEARKYVGNLSKFVFNCETSTALSKLFGIDVPQNESFVYSCVGNIKRGSGYFDRKSPYECVEYFLNQVNIQKYEIVEIGLNCLIMMTNEIFAINAKVRKSDVAIQYKLHKITNAELITSLSNEFTIMIHSPIQDNGRYKYLFQGDLYLIKPEC